jgi:hypothetical protein
LLLLVDGVVEKLMAGAAGLALCKAFVSIRTRAQRQAAIAFLQVAGSQSV